MLTVITYNDVLIIMHTVMRLLILDVVVRQLCYILTMMCAYCGSCDKKSCDQ